MGGQNCLKPLGKVFLLQLTRGDIDAYAQLQPLRIPQLHLAQNFVNPVFDYDWGPNSNETDAASRTAAERASSAFVVSFRSIGQVFRSGR